MRMFTEIKSRIVAPTPKFFKKIRKIGVTITSICTPLVAIPSNYIGAIVPDILSKICSYLIVAGVMMVSIASLAKDDSEKTENSDKCNQ